MMNTDKNSLTKCFDYILKITKSQNPYLQNFIVQFVAEYFSYFLLTVFATFLNINSKIWKILYRINETTVNFY